MTFLDNRILWDPCHIDVEQTLLYRHGYIYSNDNLNWVLNDNKSEKSESATVPQSFH